MEDYLKRLHVEEDEKWRTWLEKIPFLQFPLEYKIKIIPPFGGAMARFLVSKDGKKSVSIYLDCFERLANFDGPYWELYPHKGDVFRCAINDTESLVSAIKESLDDPK